MSSNPYPTRDAFLERFEGEENDFARDGAETIAEAIGEYEHGSADIEDVFPDWARELLTREQMIELYAKAAGDILLVLAFKGGE